MRVEPEPMAAVFFDVEPEDEEEMATSLKVMKRISELFLGRIIFNFMFVEGENRGKGGEEAWEVQQGQGRQPGQVGKESYEGGQGGSGGCEEANIECELFRLTP